MDNENRMPYEMQMRSLKSFSLIGFAMMVYIMSAQFSGFAIDKLFEKFAPEITSSPWYIPGISIAGFHLIGLPLMYLIIRKVPTGEPLGAYRTDMTFARFGMFIIIAFAGMYLSSLVTAGIYTLFDPSGIPENKVADMIVSSGKLPTLVLAVLIGPIMEEITFRGILLKRLRSWGDGPAIIISGLCFGLFHCTLIQFLYAFFLGMLFSYIVLRYGKLIYAMALHVIINGVGGLVMPMITASENVFYIGVTGLCIIGIMLGGIVTALSNRHYREINNTGLEPVYRTVLRFFLTPGSIGFILFCLILIVLGILN